MSEGHEPRFGPVFAFTTRRAEVRAFYEDVAGLPRKDEDDAALWLAGENAELVVRGPGGSDAPAEVAADVGFVIWIGVPNLDEVHRRANAAKVVVGPHYGDYFFARDPDGRFVGFYPLHEHGHEH